MEIDFVQWKYETILPEWFKENVFKQVVQTT